MVSKDSNCTVEPGKAMWGKAHFRVLLQYFLIAALITALIECLCRHSIIDTVQFLLCRPVAFFLNVFLIWFTLSFALLFRKRDYILSVVSGLWIGIAAANSILLQFRSMPLTASDIWLLSSVRDIFEKYMSPFVLILLMLLISVLGALIALLWVITKKREGLFLFGLVHFTAIGMVFISFLISFSHYGLIDSTKEFHSLPAAYDRNGFAYCFGASLITGGVEKPEDYSSDEVEYLVGEKTLELPETVSDTPNIVFVQLESFFDAAYMKDLTLSKDPIPNFRNLKANWPGGLLSVPCIGAGTANTEFEVLTGMNLSHFGVGEYPYMTIVDSGKSESVASVLGGLNYRTHAIHNNNATFYDRHIVYNNLSFHSFTSLEYMNHIETNALGWAKDTVLTEEIIKCLNAGPEKDFVFTVSVQPHGKYPKEPIEGSEGIPLIGMEEPERQIGFEYYLQELYECDRFIGELIAALQSYPEDTVVVFYGDHLPSFSIEQEELSYGTNQTTEYVIWANYPLEKRNIPLQTYQLSAYVLQLCGIYEGPVFRLHQTYGFRSESDESYQSDLNLLEYDMIYGEKYYEEEHTSSSEQMRFDVENVILCEIQLSENGLLVFGENFTPFSRFVINGEVVETEFLSPTQLLVQEILPEAGDILSIAQVSAVDSLVILSQSNELTVENDVVPPI